jgi:hypothetical protein
MPIQIVHVEVIPWGNDWEDRWAVAILYSDGRKQLLGLGSRVNAEKEASRLVREAMNPTSESADAATGGRITTRSQH